MLTRQLTKDNNGNLQATFSWCQPRGIGSEHTLRDAIADLITHGFIYRTRSHGANRAWARYAITWLPIKKTDGLFLDGFVHCAWRNWQPEKKAGGKKCRNVPAESAVSQPIIRQKVQEGDRQKVQTMNSYHVEAVPALGVDLVCTAPDSVHERTERVRDSDLTAGYWDTDSGEWIATPVKKKTKSLKVEMMREKVKPLPTREGGIEHAKKTTGTTASTH